MTLNLDFHAIFPFDNMKPMIKKQGIPDSTYEKIVFQYDTKSKAYVLNENEENKKYLKELCERNDIKIEQIASLLISIKESNSKSPFFSKLSESGSFYYHHSINILYGSMVSFFLFFLLVILEVYYYPELNLTSIFLIFGYFGFFLCFLVIIKKGNINLLVFKFATKKNIPNSAERHSIFENLNKANFELTKVK